MAIVGRYILQCTFCPFYIIILHYYGCLSLALLANHATVCDQLYKIHMENCEVCLYILDLILAG